MVIVEYNVPQAPWQVQPISRLTPITFTFSRNTGLTHTVYIHVDNRNFLVLLRRYDPQDREGYSENGQNDTEETSVSKMTKESTG